MSRRKNSILEELLDIAKVLPWWIDFAIAIIAYFWLHSIAASEVVVVAQPGKIGELVSGQLFKTLAMVGQYLLPFVFLLGRLCRSWVAKSGSICFAKLNSEASRMRCWI